MNILVVSNMYPSEEKPYSGLFVVNQVNMIKKKLLEDDTIDFYYMKRTFTGKIGSIIKYIKFFINFIIFVRNKKIKYDIIHIHYYFPTIYLALIYKLFFNRKVKIYVTFHGFDLYRTKKTFMFKFPFQYVDLCIGVSQKMCNGISKYYKGELYNISAGINEVFQKQSIDEKVYDLIFVGSFYEEKGFDRLCKVLLNIPHSLKVCIIGSGYLESNLKEVLSRKKHIIEVYNNLEQIEIVDYLNHSKMLVNLSREESFGLSMTEAMACGVPVLATRTDGSVEQIENNINGFLIQKTDETAILEEIKNIISEKVLKNDSLLKEMSKNALKTSQKYALSNIATEIINLYRNGLIQCVE